MINHKFKNYDFQDGFITDNTILNTSYSPEVLILGTFNPNTNEKDNMADFFYGRNWFWSCLFNVFEYNSIKLTTQRKYSKFPYNPSISEIKSFCLKYKLTFADLISSVFNSSTKYELKGNKVFFNGNKFDLINDNDLGKLDELKQVEWTTNDLINYLRENKTINTVYFTRNPVEPYLTQWNILINYKFNRDIKFKKIFTPSGQGLKGKPRISYLINHWLFNENNKYDTIDKEWINKYKVEINKFKIDNIE